MSNIYEEAKQMAQTLQETEQYKNLETALAAVRADDEANETFIAFQAAQKEIMAAQTSGQQPTPEQVTSWQATAEKAQKLELLGNLSKAEQGLNAMLQEINDTITNPLNEIYQTN